MDLFLVLAVHNNKNATLAFLTNLKKQTDQHFRTVLVDDGSTDGTYAEVSAGFPEVMLVKGTGDWWWTKSTNEGIRKAIANGADRVLIMNNDTLIEHTYIETIRKLAVDKPDAIIGSLDVALGQPRKVFFSGVKEIRWWKAKSIKYHNSYVPYDQSFTGLHKSICLNGRGTLIPVQVFDKIGFLDEVGLPQYASDFDFTLRADKAGIPCYISWDAVVYSMVGNTGEGKPFIYQSWFRFLRSFFKKNSQTSITMLFRYYRKHTVWYALPLALSMQILRFIYSFAKRRKAFD